MALTISGNAATTRTNLGLGTSSTLDVGTGANQVVQLDSNGKLPAVDGTALTNTNTDFNKPCFYTYNAGSISPTVSTWVNVSQDYTALINQDTCFNTSTGEWTPNVEGWYHIEGQTHIDCGSGQLSTLFTRIYKNGTINVITTEINEGSAYANEAVAHASALVYMNGTTDNLSLHLNHSDTSGSGSMAADHGNFFGWLVYPTT